MHIVPEVYTCQRWTKSQKKAVLLGMTSPIPKDIHMLFFSQVNYKDCLPVEWKTKSTNEN